MHVCPISQKSTNKQVKKQNRAKAKIITILLNISSLITLGEPGPVKYQNEYPMCKGKLKHYFCLMFIFP